MRYHLIIEYDGTDYVGWQRQKNGFSVQEALEQAIKAFTGQSVGIVGAGRTDSGVHALGQSMHCDIDGGHSANTVAKAINYHLGDNRISVVSAREAPDDFHARFSAIKRSYEYRIVNRRAPLTLTHGQAWQVPKALDVPAMSEAASFLIGHHDFTTFRSIRCQAKSPVKTLDTLEVTKEGDVIFIHTSARSFLHNQVRSMVGSLRKVGDGSWEPQKLKEILAAADRTECGPVAPALGLFLNSVEYPEI